MSDGNVGQQGQVVPEDWRELAKKAGIFKQIEDERSKAAELAAKLKEFEDAQAKAARDKELKELEDKQQYDAALTQLKAELESTKAANAKQALEASLQMSLVKEGCSNDIFLRGALAGYTGDADGVAEYVAGLKEANAQFFGVTQQAVGAEPARSASAAMSGKMNWEQVKSQITDPDPTKRKAAVKAVEQYVGENGGQLPPGF